MALRNMKHTNNKNNAEESEIKNDSLLDKTFTIPDTQETAKTDNAMMKHIPKSEIKNYIGKKVWYDVRIKYKISAKTFIESFPSGEKYISNIGVDKKGRECVWYGIFGFDPLEEYEKTYVFWAEKPDDEIRKNDRWDEEAE